MANASITQDSKVSVALFASILGGVIVIAATAVSGTWQATRWATRVDERLQSIDLKISQVTNGRWSETDMDEWARILVQLNPTLKVPGVHLEEEMRPSK